jgi:hypothetical protein
MEMNRTPASDAAPRIAKRFKDRILHNYFVRCDMSLILAVVVASGLLTSKLLLECGVRSLLWRYPIALFASYLAFLLLVRVWIWYVFPRKTRGVDLGNFNFGSIPIDGGGGGGVKSGSVHFGGGDSGGGGASGSWEEGAHADVSSSGPSSGKGGGFDLDLGDDWLVIVLLAALVLGIIFAGGYLIYVAPHLLPEAASQALLASGLARVSKPTEHHNWFTCVLRGSSIPFAVVFILVIALGWTAHRHCPQAIKLAEAFRCPAP